MAHLFNVKLEGHVTCSQCGKTEEFLSAQVGLDEPFKPCRNAPLAPAHATAAPDISAQVAAGVNRAIDENQTLKALLPENKVIKKNGNSLTTECLGCFKASVIPVNRIDKCTTEKHFSSVQNLVIEYTETMARLKADGQVDEVVNVQPLSFALFKNICDIVLAESAELLKIENKRTKIEDTKYITVLCTQSGKVFKVTGETDATLLYCDVPIQTWEDKNLSNNGSTTEEIAQPLAEVSGMGEAFKAQVGREAPKFWGVLTTGLTWTMSVRTFSASRLLYSRTVPITTWDEETNAININNVELVTSLLLTSALSAGKLTAIIDKRLKAAVSVSHMPDIDELSDHYDEDDDDDASDLKGTSKSLSKLFIQPSTEKSASGRKSGNSRGVKAGKDGDKRGKKVALQSWDLNSILSFESLARHNMLL